MATITDRNGVATANITDINGVAKANISDINGVEMTVPGVVTDNLKLYVDASDTNSYSGSGTAWDDISGETATTGYDPDVTLVNMASGSEFDSADGGSIVFDGTNDKASSGITNNDIFGTSGAFTMCCWLKGTEWGTHSTGSQTAPTILSKGQSNANGGFKVIFADTNGDGTASLVTRVTKSGSAGKRDVPNFTFDEGDWYHLTLVFSGTTIKVYQNGGSAETVTHFRDIASYVTSTNPFTIGNVDASSAPFAGNVAVVMVYSDELTQAENQQNYNADKSRFGHS